MCSLVYFARVRYKLYWWVMQVEIHRYRDSCECDHLHCPGVLLCSTGASDLKVFSKYIKSHLTLCVKIQPVWINGIWAKSGQKTNTNMCGSRRQKRCCWPGQANNPCCNVALSSLANFTCYALIFTPSDKETAVKFYPRRPVSNMTLVHDAAQNYAQRCPEVILLSQKIAWMNINEESSMYRKSELIGVLGTCREWKVNMWKFLECQKSLRTADGSAWMFPHNPTSGDGRSASLSPECQHPPPATLLCFLHLPVTHTRPNIQIHRILELDSLNLREVWSCTIMGKASTEAFSLSCYVF